MTAVHVTTIGRFAADGRVWRAFDHLLALGRGSLLLVPVGLGDGDLRRVTDGCPVPWPEVWAVLDVPLGDGRVVSPSRLAELSPLAAAHLAPYGWVRDVVPAQGTVPTMMRLTSPEGVRMALLGGVQHAGDFVVGRGAGVRGRRGGGLDDGGAGPCREG